MNRFGKIVAILMAGVLTFTFTACGSAKIGAVDDEAVKRTEELAAGEYEGISAYTPGFDGEKNEVFRYQEPKIKELFADLWTKVKAY